MSRTLVVYFSRTGTTRQVAERLAAALRADLEVITDRRRRAGPLGWLRCAVEGRLGRVTTIGQPNRFPEEYDLVVIGTPIWAGSVSSPVRSYLRRHRGALPRIAFFCTCGGTSDAGAFAQMEREAERAPEATLVVRQSDAAGSAGAAAVASFAARLVELAAGDAVTRRAPRR